MKLFTFREDNHILNGVLEDGIYYNTSTLFPSYDASFFENDGLASLKNALDTKDSSLTVIGQPEKLVFGAPFATQFTCFNGTTVQKLTQKALLGL